MIYTSKPTTIEAFRWTGDKDQEEDPEWIVEGIKNGTVTFKEIGGQVRMRIGRKYATDVFCRWAQPGDWIIRSDDGMHGTMTNECFEILYEPQKVIES
jgi:hypothetical protein